MTRRPHPWLWRALIPMVLAGVTLGACGDDDSTSPSTTVADAQSSSTTSLLEATTTTEAAGTVIEVTVTGGSVDGGVVRTKVPVGENVTIRVTADSADEVHVHGYDLYADVAPGTAAEITFTADIPGVFEVELEGSGLQLVRLEVS